MRSRRIMHGKRRKRSSCLKKTQKYDIGAGVEVAMKEPENYAPTEQDTYNPMNAGAERLKDKNMNIEREEL